MKPTSRLLLVSLSLLAAGCFPEEKLVWSPDGKQLAVIDNGLRLSTPDGLLSPATLEGVQAAAWLPDSSGLVVLRDLEFSKWEEAKAVLPPEEAKRIEQIASGVPDLAKALLAATRGEDDEMKSLFESLDLRRPEILAYAFECAKQTHRAELAAALAAQHAPADMVKSLDEDSKIKVNQIAVVLREGTQSLTAPKPLFGSLFALGTPVLSPQNGLLAFDTEAGLRVMDLEGVSSLEIAPTGALAYAWTPDGTAVVRLEAATATARHSFLDPASNSSDAPQLAQLVLRTVVDASGKLLPKATDQSSGPSDQSLAVAMVSGPQRLAVLPDGRILFASLPAQFPATEQTMPAAAKLFLLDPAQGKEAKITPVPVAPEALPSTPQFFALSPDGRKVAVVEPSSDAVAVLDLATGKVEIVSPDHGKKCRTLPAWRSTTELTFATWSEETNRPEVMTQTLGEAARKISGTWEDEVVSGLLEKQ